MATQNIALSVMEVALGAITAVFDEYTTYITAAGSLTLGWTQAMRLCKTKWQIEDLSEPEQQEPEEDDEDEWLPRYEIFTKAGTDISLLQGLERALGGEGTELATADKDSSLIMGYVVDLNIMQALLPQTMPFVKWTLRFVWDGTEDTDGDGFDITPSDMSKFDELGTTSGSTDEESSLYSDIFSRGRRDTSTSHRGGDGGESGSKNLFPKRFEPWSEYGFPDPVGNKRQDLGNASPSHHLKSLSQQKGEDLDSIDYHTYAPGRGIGATIFILDFGFDLKHDELYRGRSFRKVSSYFVPNRLTLESISSKEHKEGWREPAEGIDDDFRGLTSAGHGTKVACVAGGHDFGVARDADLFLIKIRSYYKDKITGKRRAGEITLSALTKAFQTVYDAITTGGVDPAMSVINLSFGIFFFFFIYFFFLFSILLPCVCSPLIY